MNKLFRKVWAALLAVCLMAGVAVMPASAAGTGQSFSDVPTTSYYYKSVEWAVSEGITVGTGGGKFSPDVTCTVEQIITFIWRANGSPTTSAECPFPNVKKDGPYYAAIAWSNEYDIVRGDIGATTDPCTRAMAVLYLWRASGCAEPTITVNFSDVPADAVYAKAVAWALENGITAGTGGTSFSPNQTCTRGQIVTLLYRNLVEGVEVKLPEPSNEPPAEKPSDKPSDTPATTETPKPPAGTVTTTAPGLAAYGIEPNAKLGVDYPYTTNCRRDTSKMTSGTARFTSYERADNGDGYDTITVNAIVTFADTNVQEYSYLGAFAATDYYLYETGGKDADLDDGKHCPYSITWNGKTYKNCLFFKSYKTSVNGENHILSITWEFVVPNGYDGCVAYVVKFPGYDVDGSDITKFENLIAFRCN